MGLVVVHVSFQYLQRRAYIYQIRTGNGMKEFFAKEVAYLHLSYRSGPP
jgi:hypothetical protein